MASNDELNLDELNLDELNLLEPFKRLQQILLRHWIDRTPLPRDKKDQERFLVEHNILHEGDVKFFEINDISFKKPTTVELVAERIESELIIDLGGFSGETGKARFNIYFSLSDIDLQGDCRKSVEEEAEIFIDQDSRAKPFLFVRFFPNISVGKSGTMSAHTACTNVCREPIKILLGSKKFSQHLAQMYLDRFDGNEIKETIDRQYLIKNGFLSEAERQTERRYIKDENIIKVVDVDTYPDKRLRPKGTYYIGIMKIEESSFTLHIPCPEREKLVSTFNEEEIKKWVDNDDPNDFRVPDAFCIYSTAS